MKCVWYIPSLSGECSLGLQALEVGKVGCGGLPFARCKSLMDAVLLARARGSCYICFSATADRSGLTSRSDHKKEG